MDIGGADDEYCLFIKVKDSENVIGIPSELKNFFKEKIEIARELDPAAMVYHVHDVTAAGVRKIIHILINLLGMGEQRLYEEILVPLQIDEIIELAHASTTFNVYILKDLICEVLKASVKKQLLILPSKEEKIAFLKRLSKLEDKYIISLKNDPNLPFRKFFLKIRDSERLSSKITKKITSVPLVQEKNFFLTAHGSHILWIDNNNLVHQQNLKTLAQSSFNPIAFGFKPNRTIHLIATLNGSHTCIWQDEQHVILLDNTATDNVSKLESTKPVKSVAINNAGNAVALAGTDEILLVSLIDETAKNYICTKPSSTCIFQSCFFSRNGQFLYAHYKDNGADVLCIYITKNGYELAQIRYEDRLYRAFPGKEENSFWILTNTEIKKIFLIDHEDKELFRLRPGKSIHTETTPNKIEYMLVNDDESFILLQTNRSTVEIINVPAGRTECVYHMFQTAAFSPNQKGMIAIEDEDNEDGTYTILETPFLPTTVTTDINQLFDSLTLAQITQLDELITISDKNRRIKELKQFLSGLSYDVQQIINIYVFPGLIHQRPQSPSDEPPTKKQKKS